MKLKTIDLSAGEISVLIIIYNCHFVERKDCLSKNKELYRIIDEGSNWIMKYDYYTDDSTKRRLKYIFEKGETKEIKEKANLELEQCKFFEKNKNIALKVKENIEIAKSIILSQFDKNCQVIIWDIVNNIFKDINNKIKNDGCRLELILKCWDGDKSVPVTYFADKLFKFVSMHESKIGSIYFNSKTPDNWNNKIGEIDSKEFYANACRIRLTHFNGPSVEYFPFTKYTKLNPIEEKYYDLNRNEIGDHPSRGEAKDFCFSDGTLIKILLAAHSSCKLIDNDIIDPYTANKIFTEVLNRFSIKIPMDEPICD